MDTPLQPSFIPKKPVVGGPQSTRSSGGIFYFISTTVFTITVIASIAVFGYELYLNGRIFKMETELADAREALQPDLIKQLSRSNSRFLSAEEILKKHVTVSALFASIEKLTLQNVRFSSFGYDTKTDDIIVIMKGEATTYATVAQQAKVIAEDPAFKTSLFSDLDLNTKGNVVFTLKATINPKAVSYESNLNTTLNPSSTQILPSLPAASSTASTTLPTQPRP